MPARDDVQSLMLEIGERNGIEIFKPDDEGTYVFNSNNKIQLSIRVLEEKQEVVLFTCLYEGGMKDETLYKKMLCSNFLCIDTQGAAFSLEPKTGSTYLCRSHPIKELDCDTLEKIIGAFLNVAHEWHERLANTEAIQAGENKPEHTTPATDHIRSLA